MVRHLVSIVPVPGEEVPMPEPVRYGTEIMKLVQDAPVPDSDYACRNADTGGSARDDNALLCCLGTGTYKGILNIWYCTKHIFSPSLDLSIRIRILGSIPLTNG